MRRQPARGVGFTLLELMIVVAIVGILAALAYPGYVEYVRAGRRADAEAALVELASRMERYYSEHLTYEGAATSADQPRFYADQVPVGGGRAYYRLRITAADHNSFTLRAIPVNDQAGDGFLQLKSTGKRAWDRDNSNSIAVPEEQCWREQCG